MLQGKAKVQAYPLQMTEILDRPFDKIAIDLVIECETSNSGNKHILTIIDHLRSWPEAFPIPDKSADTIVSIFITHYLPVHMCPRYILSDNGMEFKNCLLDQVLKELGVKRIFSATYHPQSNGKLEVFHKYLKPTLKKLCVKDPSNRDKYINKVLASNTKPCHSRNIILPSLWKRSKFTPTPASRAYAMILGDPDSGLLNLEAHRLALAITKKTIDENCFRTAQKMMDRQPPSFKIGDRVYFKNK